jgi:hypothetical protein
MPQAAQGVSLISSKPPIRQTGPLAANCIADHLKAIAIF